MSAEGALRCESCGAPFGAGNAGEAPDYRYCPYCKRRLLALGSPACNHCGRHLPKDYIHAREATRRHINEVSEGSASAEHVEELERDSDDAMRRALKSLFDLDDKTKRD